MIKKFQDDDLLRGLLAFAPLVMSVSSLYFGFKLGLMTFAMILLLASVIFFSRKLFLLPQQQLVFVLIAGVSLLTVAKMLLEAEAYSFADKIGLFLPLLLINSLVLSVNESVFSLPDYKSIMHRVFKVAFAALLFFIVFGLLQELLNEVSFLASPAGFLFLFGLLFATINYMNEKRLSKI